MSDGAMQSLRGLLSKELEPVWDLAFPRAGAKQQPVGCPVKGIASVPFLMAFMAEWFAQLEADDMLGSFFSRGTGTVELIMHMQIQFLSSMMNPCTSDDTQNPAPGPKGRDPEGI